MARRMFSIITTLVAAAALAIPAGALAGGGVQNGSMSDPGGGGQGASCYSFPVSGHEWSDWLHAGFGFDGWIEDCIWGGQIIWSSASFWPWEAGFTAIEQFSSGGGGDHYWVNVCGGYNFPAVGRSGGGCRTWNVYPLDGGAWVD